MTTRSISLSLSLSLSLSPPPVAVAGATVGSFTVTAAPSAGASTAGSPPPEGSAIAVGRFYLTKTRAIQGASAPRMLPFLAALAAWLPFVAAVLVAIGSAKEYIADHDRKGGGSGATSTITVTSATVTSVPTTSGGGGGGAKGTGLVLEKTMARRDAYRIPRRIGRYFREADATLSESNAVYRSFKVGASAYLSRTDVRPLLVTAVVVLVLQLCNYTIGAFLIANSPLQLLRVLVWRPLSFVAAVLGRSSMQLALLVSQEGGAVVIHSASASWDAAVLRGTAWWSAVHARAAATLTAASAALSSIAAAAASSLARATSGPAAAGASRKRSGAHTLGAAITGGAAALLIAWIVYTRRHHIAHELRTTWHRIAAMAPRRSRVADRPPVVADRGAVVVDDSASDSRASGTDSKSSGDGHRSSQLAFAGHHRRRSSGGAVPSSAPLGSAGSVSSSDGLAGGEGATIGIRGSAGAAEVRLAGKAAAAASGGNRRRSRDDGGLPEPPSALEDSPVQSSAVSEVGFHDGASSPRSVARSISSVLSRSSFPSALPTSVWANFNPTEARRLEVCVLCVCCVCTAVVQCVATTGVRCCRSVSARGPSCRQSARR
jgi:hypothetical protein